MIEIIPAGKIYRGELSVSQVLRLSASDDYSGSVILDSHNPDAPRFPLAAGDNVLCGPYIRNRLVRIDVFSGAVEIDTHHREAEQLVTDFPGVRRADDAKSRPAAFEIDDWTLTNAGNVKIEALPSAGYSPIVGVEYSLDGGDWTPAPGARGFDVGPLPAGPHVVAIRALNFIGAGPASDLKTLEH